MGVAVDEARQDEVVCEIDDRGSSRDGEGRVLDGANAVAVEDKNDVCAVASGAALKQMAHFDIGDACGRGEGA